MNQHPFEEQHGAEPAVRGVLHGSLENNPDCLILTHGAGANCHAPLLEALGNAFSGGGWATLRCDLPFRQARPSGPPPRGAAVRDQQGLVAAVHAIQQQTTGRIFLGGHSYGGRMASMAAAEHPGLATAMLFLSYPLHPPERPEQLRTEHFPRLQTPALFVSGAKDGFGTESEMQTALQLIPAVTELMMIAGAGHELASKRNRDQTAQAIVQAFQTFVQNRARK